ncbi:DISARM system SNF2-like helicase DrmD [Micromonospora tulbaghiae]|uniref:Superfamily II DNA or RNA helicase, SNF2 family n=1 Tax=Micromonospora tulbaghiae TaxID=479978 RepID=A0ABY0KNZ3_9ACTN|nr:DISARM system SNF2-like helicase DrmD [Micromonospora tulbaghiae]SCE95068.1 Superfamily II DNA or RNA helicase, SNF2 family [Micromonospora tulbaghiae]
MSGESSALRNAESHARDLGPVSAPEPGQLVSVRGRRWVVADKLPSSITSDRAQGGATAPENLLTLTSIEDDSFDETISVVWEVEAGARAHESSELPRLAEGQSLDAPETLDAFLDAVRWGALTSADRSLLQAPFRSGIDIQPYQLDPLVRALSMPRANLLIADDVGLGKTIEAGLVIQELILRYRARTVLIVCPASLCIQWQEQMQEKFGLEFRVLDTEMVRSLRRERGVRVNPFTHFPRLIMSVDWLKRDRPMRMLREVLPKEFRLPRAFDMLVVDEVHSCAPTGQGRYAVDSLRTKAIRELAPHCEHRLFLSATPHNGYLESFTALLELLDDQRFARGVPPDERQLKQIMVRRLKSELTTEFDGRPLFPPRRIVALPVDYTAEERRVHEDLRAYTESRVQRANGEGDAARVAVEFSLTTLKKRLFSSPAAFARTLATHIASQEGGRPAREKRPPVTVLRDAFAAVEDALDTGDADDNSYESLSRRALVAAGDVEPTLSAEDRARLDRMSTWAERARYQADSKLDLFLSWLAEIAGPEQDERVIVFTEYRDTLRWLQEQLEAHGYGVDNRIEVLHGGLDTHDRDRIKKEFLAADSPVRILLATDAASEGIDLQERCHRLVHWEIPWNPNRLEQRNGRIDRHGQQADEVLIHHFVGAGWTEGANADARPGSLDGDLHFLAQAVRKVEQIRTDLGSVGPVIADQVTEAMLGRRRTALDTSAAERAAAKRAVLSLQRQLAAEVEKLVGKLHESRSGLRLTPDAVRRVVEVGLRLGHQQQLAPTVVSGFDGEFFTVPPLADEWARTVAGIAHPRTGKARPVTFDDRATKPVDRRRSRQDVVHLHLGHPLVQQCLRLLRAEVWSGGREARLSRVTARVVPDDALAEPAVLAHGRLVVTGRAGTRLHEQIITAGGWLRQGRFASFASVRETEHAVAVARDSSIPCPPEIADRLAGLLPKTSKSLIKALERRRDERQGGIDKMLLTNAEQEAHAAEETLRELGAAIRKALAENPHEQLALFELTSDERMQLHRDREALLDRLDRIPEDIALAREAVHRRYADPTARFFPVAVEFLIPRRAAR